jgi:hypothetical protein
VGGEDNGVIDYVIDCAIDFIVRPTIIKVKRDLLNKILDVLAPFGAKTSKKRLHSAGTTKLSGEL